MNNKILFFLSAFIFLTEIQDSGLLFAQFPGHVGDAEWTQHMIKKEDRFFDFKTVARGTRSEHRFLIKNPFEKTVHIASISSSCTCTTAYVEDNDNTLQTYEEKAIVAWLHTDRFDGKKSATITVLIDQPLLAEFQLNIRGEIRSDISISPNWVRFDHVKDNTAAERNLTISYTGPKSNWKIVDFKSDHEHLSAKIVDVSAQSGLIVTKVKVTLSEKMKKGPFTSKLFLVSNDESERREIPIVVRGTVGKSITISPPTVFLGFLEQGETSPIKTATVRGTVPFKITKLLCNNPAVQVGLTPIPEAPPRIFYQIPIQYTNPKDGSGSMKDGKLEAVIQVETDDPDLKPTFKVTAQLKKSDSPNESDD